MKVVAPSGKSMIGRFGARFSFALPRTRFDAILRNAAEAAGAVVRESVKVEDLVYDGGAVGGVVGAGETHRARVVVGADGLRSVVARRTSGVRTSAPRRVAFTAHVSEVAGVSDVGEMHVGRTGYVGLGPIGAGVTTVALVVPVRGLNRRPDFFQALERFPGLAGRFDPRRMVRDVLATGPFAQWSRRPVAPGGGALLVGDAADFFDPFTGQGIYSALRGAELAATCLIPALSRGVSGPLPHAALQGYARARRREFTGKWLLERLIGLGVGWPALVERVVSRLARRGDLADLLVRATGNCVPARAVLAPGVLAGLLW
jgi:flavin-dependent dehydrogenase